MPTSCSTSGRPEASATPSAPRPRRTPSPLTPPTSTPARAKRFSATEKPRASGSTRRLVGLRRRHVPTGRRHLAGLVEHAAVGAGERKGLVRLDPAALELVAACGRLHDVM